MNDNERMTYMTDRMMRNIDDVLQKIDRMRKNIVVLQDNARDENVDAFAIALDISREITWTTWNVDMTSIMRIARDLDDMRRENAKS
jgi:accessory colonization factor AcfC